jgi:WD40 repeat protein
VLRTFEAGAVINDIDINNKNDQIAVARKDGRITLLDMQTGNRRYDLQAFGSLKLASFSPNGTYIATGSSSGSVTLWNLETGFPVSSSRHKGEVLALAFSPNSRYLITGGQDGYVVGARAFDGQEAYRLLHEDWVEGITFSADGAWFVTVSNDKRIRAWDTVDGSERLRMAQENFVHAAQISGNGQWIASTGADRTVRIWNTSTGSEMFQIPVQSEGLALGFNGDATRLVAGDAGGGIYIWDISVMPVPENHIQFNGLVVSASFSPVGDWVAVSDGPRVWLLRSGQLSTLTSRSLSTPTFTLNGNVTSVVFSSDSKWLGASTDNGQVFVYNLQTRQTKTLFQSGSKHQIAFSPNNETLIVSSLERVEQWSLLNSSFEFALAENGSGIVSVAAGPTYTALGQVDAIVLLSPEGDRVAEIASPGDHLLLTFSADGSLLASSNSAGLIEIWRIREDSYELVGTIRKENVYSMAFNANGSQLAVGTANIVYLLDTLSVEETARIPQAGNVTGVSYLAEGNTLATTSLRSLQLWNLSKVQKIYESTLVTDACNRLTANFTDAQWRNFFGDDPYTLLCDNLPKP